VQAVVHHVVHFVGLVLNAILLLHLQRGNREQGWLQ
jgi:hypothetical protein